MRKGYIKKQPELTSRSLIVFDVGGGEGNAWYFVFSVKKSDDSLYMNERVLRVKLKITVQSL